MLFVTWLLRLFKALASLSDRIDDNRVWRSVLSAKEQGKDF